MKNFTIISILLALAAAGMLWKELIVKSKNDVMPKPVVISTPANDQADYTEFNGAGDCDEYDQEPSDCVLSDQSVEHDEMEQQNQQGHNVMMKSYNEKLEKYNKQIGGRP